IERKVATAVHDVSDGGLAVAVAEMAIAGGIGAHLDVGKASFGQGRVRPLSRPLDPYPHPAFWFGEDQARYVVTVRESDAATVLNFAGNNRIPVRRIGTTGGSALTLPAQRPILVTRLSERFEGWLPGYMSGGSQRSGV